MHSLGTTMCRHSQQITSTAVAVTLAGSAKWLLHVQAAWSRPAAQAVLLSVLVVVLTLALIALCRTSQASHCWATCPARGWPPPWSPTGPPSCPSLPASCKCAQQLGERLPSGLHAAAGLSVCLSVCLSVPLVGHHLLNLCLSVLMWYMFVPH